MSNQTEPSKPYVDANGNLRIPLDCDPKYHHRKPSGQSVIATLKEIGASPDQLAKYILASQNPVLT
jgi:hypothetical protein